MDALRLAQKVSPPSDHQVAMGVGCCYRMAWPSSLCCLGTPCISGADATDSEASPRPRSFRVGTMVTPRPVALDEDEEVARPDAPAPRTYGSADTLSTPRSCTAEASGEPAVDSGGASRRAGGGGGSSETCPDLASRSSSASSSSRSSISSVPQPTILGSTVAPAPPPPPHSAASAAFPPGSGAEGQREQGAETTLEAQTLCPDEVGCVHEIDLSETPPMIPTTPPHSQMPAAARRTRLPPGLDLSRVPPKGSSEPTSMPVPAVAGPSAPTEVVQEQQGSNGHAHSQSYAYPDGEPAHTLPPLPPMDVLTDSAAHVHALRVDANRALALLLGMAEKESWNEEEVGQVRQSVVDLGVGKGEVAGASVAVCLPSAASYPPQDPRTPVVADIAACVKHMDLTRVAIDKMLLLADDKHSVKFRRYAGIVKRSNLLSSQ